MDLDIRAIHTILPHRYPFLLIDKVLTIEDDRAVGIKNVTMNEWFFQGHFPERPVMPGVLVLESMAQVGATMMMNLTDYRNCIPYFTSLRNVKFRRPVVPGDTMVIEVTLIRMRKRMGKIRGIAKVDEQVVAEGEIGFSLIEQKGEGG